MTERVPKDVFMSDAEWAIYAGKLEEERAAIAKAMNAYPDSDLVSLVKTLVARDKRCTELEERISNALKHAAGRWSEWGDRAMSVWEILDPGETPDESKS